MCGSRFCSYRQQGKCLLWFSLGLTCTCICPKSFVLALISVALIVLAITLIRL